MGSLPLHNDATIQMHTLVPVPLNLPLMLVDM